MPARRRTVPAPAAAPRFPSLDAFRGFVILTMIWVNYCSGVEGLPKWMFHAPSDQDTYTFVDLVFPGFLFIVGVAIPFAVGRRVAAGASPWSLLPRILWRSAGLIYLGVICVNLDGFYSESATGLSQPAFMALFLPAMAVVWADPPRGSRLAAWLRRLRWPAVAVLVVLTAVFRRTLAEHGTGAPFEWLRPEWWGILGLIGWAYLGSVLAYLLVGGRTAALVAVLALELAVYVGDGHGSLPHPLGWLAGFAGDPARLPAHLLRKLDEWVGIATLWGSTSAIVAAGMVAGSLFAPEPRLTRWRRPLALVAFGAALWSAGMLIRPVDIISKDHGTAAYSLVASGEVCLLFALFHVAMDLRGWTRWAFWLVPAGVNALMAYFLPDFLEALTDLTHTSRWIWWYPEGWTGAANAAVVSLVLVGLTARLTRAGFRLRL